MELISYERLGLSDWVITVETKFLWFKPKRLTYRGNCTVWHSYPSGQRAPTHIENRLCDIWQTAQWALTTPAAEE